MSRSAEKYWHLLNTFEDYLKHGERLHREPPRNLTFKAAARPAGAAGRQQGRGMPADTASRSGRGTATDADRTARLEEVARRVATCTRCPLHGGRMHTVPGAGVLDPLVMVIGEGPGAEEDRRGEPFVGRAGQYLDRWLEAIDVSRTQNAFIGNIIKCRPPGNRDPNPGESDACMPYLKEQIEIVRPHTILTVGRIASSILIGSTAGVGSLRGKTFSYNGIPLVPTYHPAAVLRNPDLRRPVWDDLKRLAGLFPSGPDDE
jgi:DNA polymerase